MEAMLEKYQVYTSKPKDKAELKVVLEAIWADLHQQPSDKAVLALGRDSRHASEQMAATLNISCRLVDQ